MKLSNRIRYLRTALTGRTPAFPKAAARYAGGDHSRLVSRWFAELADANDEIRLSLASLRARSRELVQDNGEAAGLMLDFESDIVGATGARLQFRAKSPRGTPLDALNDRVETAWRTWARRDHCTVTGRLSFAALQRLAIRSIVCDGEFLALRRRAPDTRFGYQLQVIDPDQLDETHNLTLDGGRRIIMGVEVDADGRPVAYHLWSGHPTKAEGRQRRRVPADQVLHVFKALRPGQVRGVPWFAPSLVNWKLGARYTEAELYQSLLAAAQGGFFVNKDGGAFDIPVDEEGKPIPLVMEAEPGAARVLPGGYEFQAWEPKHPTANFGGFMKVVKRGIARAFGRSYASLTGDLADVNFSSMRTDRVREIEQNKLHQQDLLVEQLCDVVFADWLRMATVTGAIGTVSIDSATLASHATWMCKGWPWIDPVKDITAATMAVQQGLTSRQQLCAEKGLDYFEVIDQLAEEVQYAAAKGVTLGESAVDPSVADDAPPAAIDGETPARTVLPLRARSA